jgi:hypothetical protein
MKDKLPYILLALGTLVGFVGLVADVTPVIWIGVMCVAGGVIWLAWLGMDTTPFDPRDARSPLAGLAPEDVALAPEAWAALRIERPRWLSEAVCGWISETLTEADLRAASGVWRMDAERFDCRYVQNFVSRWTGPAAVHVTFDLAAEEHGPAAWQVELAVTRVGGPRVDVWSVLPKRSSR